MEGREEEGEQRSVPTHVVHTPIDTHHCASMHIPDQSIVLDWQIASGATAIGLHGKGRR
jgi:hypothetical protein